MNRRGLWLAILAVAIAVVLVLLLRRDAPPDPAAPPPTATPVPAAAPAPPPAAPEPPPVVPVPETPAPEPTAEPEFLTVLCAVRTRDGAPVEGARVSVDFESPIHGPDGMPAAAALVDAARAGSREARTDAEGRCSLEVRLPAGSTIPLLASAPGFLPQRRGVLAFLRNLEKRIAFALDRSGVFEGRVVDPEGAPVAGATVTAESIRGELRSSPAAAGPDGRFRIEDAPEGECRVVAYSTAAPPHGRAWTPGGRAAFAKTGTLDLEIVLQWVEARGATVRITVVDASGVPVAVKQADLLPLDRWYYEIPSRAFSRPRLSTGSVTLDAVREGRWRVWVETAEHGVCYTDFEVAPGDAAVESRTAVRSFGRLRGRVRSEGIPTPRNGWQVGLELHGNGYFPQFSFVDPENPGSIGRRERPTRMETADAEGNFRVADLQPGRYRVTLYGTGVSAAADAEIRAGEESAVELVATRSAKVTFRLARPEWGLAYALSCWEEGGIRKPGLIVAPKDDGAIVVVKEMHPGRIHWIVEWKASSDRNRREDLRRAAEGTVEVAPGASATVEVPAPPEDQPQTPR
ncbi:MAG TPA: carboxypeptidase regulatory-like domain-containing protein [Planctomycetota bacterium]|nr:carboxypeptidase regulatory-like domain-containing protein [Planctomycetota bacterium]